MMIWLLGGEIGQRERPGVGDSSEQKEGIIHWTVIFLLNGNDLLQQQQRGPGWFPDHFFHVRITDAHLITLTVKFLCTVRKGLSTRVPILIALEGKFRFFQLLKEQQPVVTWSKHLTGCHYWLSKEPTTSAALREGGRTTFDISSMGTGISGMLHDGEKEYQESGVSDMH